MAQSNYIYNPTTQLWYPIIATGTGDDIHTEIDANGGTLTPPAYIASVGEPLISEDAFLCFAQVSALPVASANFTAFAVVASDQIEAYCRRSWRILGETVPVSVQMVCAFATRDLLAKSTPSQYKSYSGGDYSWTMQDGIQPGDIIAPYKAMLAPYRELSVYA